MPSLNAHPSWVPDELSVTIESWVDWTIAARANVSNVKLSHNDLNEVSTAVMTGLYALVDAQVVIQENRKAYDAEL